MSAIEIRSLNGYKLTDEIARSNIEKLRTESQQYTNTKISQLINGAPTTLDTLGEIAAAMAENATVVEALDAAIGQKANKSDIPSLDGLATEEYVAEAIASVPKGEPDWNAKEGEEGYIKNKPFGVGPNYFRYEYSGNIDDYETVEINLGGFYAKISDTYLTKEELLGAKLSGTIFGDVVFDESFLNLEENGVIRFSYTTDFYSVPPNVMCEVKDCFGEKYYLTTGIWFFVSMDLVPAVTSVEKIVIHQLDEKFIPDTIARKEDFIQSDWNVNDENDPAYVKNRTHYDDGFEFTYDGNYQNYEYYPAEDGYAVKISDQFLTLDDFIGAKVASYVNGKTGEQIINEDDIKILEDGSISVLYMISLPNSKEIAGGLYFLHIDVPDVMTLYTTNLSKESIKQLDEKYIPVASPETLGGIKVGSGLTIDANGVLSLSVTNASGVSF